MPGKPDAHADAQTQDRRVDEASEESFPASDPASFTPGKAGGGVDAHGDEAKGTPHSDRQASETAAGRHEGNQPAETKPH